MENVITCPWCNKGLNSNDYECSFCDGRGEVECNIDDIHAEFQRKVNVVFPEIGLDPAKASISVWIRRDTDDNTLFPCIGFRYAGLKASKYGERSEAFDRSERAFWPCTTLNGNRMDEGLLYAIGFITKH